MESNPTRFVNVVITVVTQITGLLSVSLEWPIPRANVCLIFPGVEGPSKAAC